MSSAHPTRRRVSREERRRTIVAAAREEFIAAGLQGARTKSIAGRAGVTEAVLYRHFESKDELFREAVVAPLEQMMDDLEGVGRGLPPGTDDRQRENTRHYIVCVMETMRDSFDLLGVVLFADRAEGQDFYRRRLAGVLDRSIAIVHSNQDSWSHRAFDPAFSVPATIGMCWFLAVDAAYRGRELDIDGLADQMIAMIFDGLAKPPTPAATTTTTTTTTPTPSTTPRRKR